MDEATKDKVDAYAAHIPQIYQSSYKTAMKGRSLRAAINSKCLDCTNWQRTEVKHCPIPTCSLYPYRPYQDKLKISRKRANE